ncbi:MAG: hypothetical protein DRJ52_06735 [Thermoprotei archaeon]|nr:MAG: hypothetical protein DRJ52_06735 [Thermoprotei archaeon]RLF00074.1 MAG: hypothetical protein DRJ63_03530 [Thermoprotei archaeon]
MREVRVGVIGAGGVFRGAHLPAYAKISEARLVAIADPVELALKAALRKAKEIFLKEAEQLNQLGLVEEAERLKQISSEIRVYRDYHEMLKKEELDLVDVCTPHKYHAPAVVDSLRAGVNAMVEKPPARTYIEALDIVEAVRESEKLFQVNENYIFASGIYLMRKLIETGVVGEVEYVIVPCSHYGPEGKAWFWHPEIGGGGSLLDMGVHAIGVAWYLVGLEKKPVAVKAEKFTGVTIRSKERFIDGLYTKIRVEDDAHVLIRFEDPEDGSTTTALIEGSWSGKEFSSITIYGTRGFIRDIRRDGKLFLEVNDYAGSSKLVEVQGTGSTIVSEIRYMCKCVLSGTKSLLNEEYAAEVMAIIDSAYYSEMKGRRTVLLEEFKGFAEKLRQEYGERASDKFIEMKTKLFSS